MRDLQGRTALHVAASEGRESCITLLLQSNVDIDQKDRKGRTALHLAALNGNCRIVELLLAKGANVNAII